MILFIATPIWIYKKLHKKEVSAYSTYKYRDNNFEDFLSPKDIAEIKFKEKKSKEIKKETKEEKVEVEIEHKQKESSPDESVKEEKEAVSIHVDFSNNIYKYYSLNKHERKYLMEEGYHFFESKCMISDKEEKYLIKPRFNESVLHFFTIWNIMKFLESKGIMSRLFTTKKPDLVFYINRKSYAIEVETGSVLKRSKKQVIEKYQTMKKDYNYGLIVVPVRRMVRQYRAIVPAIDSRYVKNKLLKIIKNSEK